MTLFYSRIDLAAQNDFTDGFMRIGILSFRPVDKRFARMSTIEERGLKNVAKEMGHISKIFRASRFQIVYDKKSPELFYDGKYLKNYDVFIVRPSVLEEVDLHVVLVSQMEMKGIILFNKYQSILNAKNKIKTMQILDHKKIPIPKTVLVHRPEDLAQAAKFVGGFPVIVKRPIGSFGHGVMIVESMRALQSVLTWEEPVYLLQEYVKYSKGKDIRIFVINGKVVGSMMRVAKKGEFRSNIGLGGTGIPVDITPEEADIAIKGVEALGLDYGGVDVIRSVAGPVILEINSNPGFKELERATGVNISKALVEYAVELACQHGKGI